MLGTFNSFIQYSPNPAVGAGNLCMYLSGYKSAYMSQIDVNGKLVSLTTLYLENPSPPYLVIRVEDSTNSSNYAEFLLNRIAQAVPSPSFNSYSLYSKADDLKGATMTTTPSKVIVYYYKNGDPLPTKEQLNPTTTLAPTTTIPTTTLPTTTLPTTTLANSYGMLGTFNSYLQYWPDPGVTNGNLGMNLSTTKRVYMSIYDFNGKLVLLQTLYYANASPPYLVIRVEDSTNSSNYAEFLLNGIAQAGPSPSYNSYSLYNKADDLKGATMTTIPSKVIVYYYKDGNPLPTKEQLNPTMTIPTTTLAPITTIPTTIQAPTTLQPTITVQPVQGQSTGFYTEKAIAL
jgi:hypothetical protein